MFTRVVVHLLELYSQFCGFYPPQQINHEILHTELAGRGAEGGRGVEEGHGADSGRDSLSPPPSSAMSASGAIQQTKAILSSSKKVRDVHVSMLNSNWPCLFHIIR